MICDTVDPIYISNDANRTTPDAVEGHFNVHESLHAISLRSILIGLQRNAWKLDFQ